MAGMELARSGSVAADPGAMSLGLSVDAWNEMMRTFLNELCNTLSDVPAVLAARSAFNVALAGGDKERVMKVFIAAVEPMHERILAKDESLVTDGSLGSLEIFQGCDFQRIWFDEMDAGTREAIWSYLSTLYSIGKTMEIIPGEMLGSIERVAQSCGDAIKAGDMDMSEMNPASVGARLAAELGQDSELGQALAAAATALQDPTSAESQQAAMLQGMMGGLLAPQGFQ